jgi:hypothetical protein
MSQIEPLSLQELEEQLTRWAEDFDSRATGNPNGRDGFKNLAAHIWSAVEGVRSVKELLRDQQECLDYGCKIHDGWRIVP